MTPGRPKPTATLFVFSLLSTATYVLTRGLGASLFLARMGSEALPLALGASAITVVAFSVATRLALRYAKASYCLTTTWVALAALSLVLSYKIVAQPFSLIIIGSIFVLAEVRGSLNTVYTTTMANDYFADSVSKNPYVLVSAGAPIAGIVAGFFLSYEAAAISDTTWLAIIAGLDLFTILLTRLLPARMPQKRQKPQAPQTPTKASYRLRKYGFGVAALVALQVGVLTLVGFQWHLVVNDYMQTEHNMIRYFAAFYAINDGLILLIQITASGKLLDRFGIGMPLMAYPVCLAGIGMAALAVNSLPMLMIIFTVGSGLNVLRRSVHDPGLVAAFAILDPRVRSKTIVLVKGMIKPFVEFIAATGLIFYADMVSPNVLTWVWVALLLPWFFVSRWVSRRYSQESGSARAPNSHWPMGDES